MVGLDMGSGWVVIAQDRIALVWAYFLRFVSFREIALTPFGQNKKCLLPHPLVLNYAAV